MTAITLCVRGYTDLARQPVAVATKQPRKAEKDESECCGEWI